jgi:prepilin-type N-terminal cleavage/methylation domain-containing protein
MKPIHRAARSDGGFTLVEMAIALVIFAVIAIAIYGVLVRTNQGQAMGMSEAEAQQNARAALDAILRDMRGAGWGITPATQVPIETASEYRITFVSDRNQNSVIDPGERITYFVDSDQSDAALTQTPNPDDYCIRRVVSTAGDTAATPAAGAGTIVAYGVTQRTANHSGWNVHLFDYFASNGTSLVGNSNDPTNSVYGHTVPDSALGKPAGNGWNSSINTLQVQVVTEGSQRDAETHTYRQARVTGTIHPRNMGVNGRAFFSSIGAMPPATGGSGTGTGTGTATGTGTGSGTGTGTGLPPEEPPIRIPTERVLSLTLCDLQERDSQEGSQQTTDNQHDWDILIGTQASGTNNLAIWFEGLTARYSGSTLYSASANYHGYSPRDINQLATGNLNEAVDGTFPDVVAAEATGDITGGFEVWLNQGTLGKPGWLGTGVSSTVASGYYSQGSGKGLSIALADFDRDGDLDVAFGTRIAANQGKVEIWSNNGIGVFVFQRAFSIGGEVNTLAVADFNNDGYPDFAYGTRTTNSGDRGKVGVYLNQGSLDFNKLNSWDSHGQVKALAAATMDAGTSIDLVAGLQSGVKRGEVELWLNDGTGAMTRGDSQLADDVVLSVAVGPIDYGNTSNDIVAGTAARSVQCWFCDRAAATPDKIIPSLESWADANAGGLVNAVSIVKVEATKDNADSDLLNDIVCGTAKTTTSGEIVIYLNPYVWTLNP